MAGRGVSDTFADGLFRLLGELGKLQGYGDADDGLIDTIRQQVIQAVRSRVGQVQPQMGQQMGQPMPITEAEMSRGPIPGMQTGEASAALERILSGQEAV